MARTKKTAASVDSGEMHQGSLATFKPRDEARAPNMFKCKQCERKFGYQKNLTRHVKQFHGPKTYRFACPWTPARQFSRRSDLRVHYQAQHPEADEEEVDDMEMIEIETVKIPSSSESTAPQSPKKKQKTRSETPRDAASTSQAQDTSEPSSGATFPLVEIAALGGEKGKLKKITETITREYFFE
jgi:uncharacterized C2H2 Zn-finger protein